MTIKVMIVDDSAVVRQCLKSIFDKHHDIEVVAAVQDPIFALKRLEKITPDVITLDIEMPRMDGITFLTKIMKENPIPVVMCSTLTTKSSRTSIQALSIGAVDVITKPTMNLKQSLGDSETEIINSVRAAAKVNLSKVANTATNYNRTYPNIRPKLNADVIVSKPMGRARASSSIVALGASTGGTQALERVLVSLTTECPGIVIVQHMPEAFTAAFAERLDSLCCIHVKEGQTGDEILPGKAIIAPGGKHMIVKTKYAGAPYIEVKDGPLVSRHKPSVDVLFRSVAKAIGQKSLGIIMTGMGDDGANGLLEMRQSGARTVAQDEASCVIFGMPAVAIQKEATDEQLPLDNIAALIEAFAPKRNTKLTPNRFKW